MKKRVLVLMVGFLFIGVNGFAADGDLIVNGNTIVNGNVGIGTTSPTAKLEVIGTFAIQPGSVRLVATYKNFGEDTYGAWEMSGTSGETCGEGSAYLYVYTCAASDSKTCIDVAFSEFIGGGFEGCGGAYCKRTITCKQAVIFLEP
jgi:hypothetical protein